MEGLLISARQEAKKVETETLTRILELIETRSLEHMSTESNLRSTMIDVRPECLQFITTELRAQSFTVVTESAQLKQRGIISVSWSEELHKKLNAAARRRTFLDQVMTAAKQGSRSFVVNMNCQSLFFMPEDIDEFTRAGFRIKETRTYEVEFSTQ